MLRDAGFAGVHVSPRMVYTDDSRQPMVEAFVRKIIIPMVEGVEQKAIESGWMGPAAWRSGIEGLHQTASQAGTFCYTFFKGLGRR